MQENLLKGWQNNIKMKKIKYLFFLFIIVLSVTSCFKKTCEITFDTDGGTIISNQEVKKGDKVIKPSDPIKDDYTFNGWYVYNNTNEFILFDFNNEVEENITLYAKYTKNQYTIVYDYNYIEKDQTEEITFTNLNDVTLVTPTRAGYKFLGWYENDTLVTSIEKKNYNLVAKWKKTHYIIEYVIDDNNKDIQLLEMGQPLNELLFPTKEGYEFLGWYCEETKIELGDDINSDLVLIANWKAYTYNVRFITYTDIAIPVQKVDYGELVEEPDIPIKEGYNFLGWICIDEYYDFTKPVSNNIQLIADWKITEEKIQEYIQSLIPAVITENIPTFSNLKFCDATFVWTSSNQDAITNDGNVRRLVKDSKVIISVEVIYDTSSYILTFETIVPKIELKPLVSGKIVSGYLYGSGGFSDLSEQTLKQLDYINFSFASIVNGEIALPDSKYVEQILSYRNSGVRIGLALGGWGAGGFSEAMSTASSRTKLVNSIMNILKDYQFDGIDIDWEYPTSSVAGITSSPSDRNNLTLFVEELKSRMNLYRDDLVLSIAIAPSNSFYDLKALNNYIDYFNLMTYDFSMGTTAGHDSGLYSTSVTSSSLDNSVNIVSEYVDNNKIIPGAAFYARYGSFSSTNNAKLGGTLSVAMSKVLSFKKMYERIISNNLTEQYDVDAEAAYIISGTTFYSYDNIRSVAAKCKYVKENNLAGLMCWELTQDYIDENGNSVLLNCMYDNLK